MKETKPHEGERRDVIGQLENQIATYSDVLYEKWMKYPMRNIYLQRRACLIMEQNGKIMLI